MPTRVFRRLPTTYVSKKHRYPLTDFNSVSVCSCQCVGTGSSKGLESLLSFLAGSTNLPASPLSTSCKLSALGLAAMPEVLPMSEITVGLQAGP